MILGCVADDFTGASDAASFLCAGGASVILSNGIPDREDVEILSAQAIVIALKIRTVSSEEAVKQSMEAFSWLKSHGAEILYYKYCSTFDSTEKGNIGPVLDAVLEKWNIPYTILCPSLLENGRMVKNGNLYVNGVLLEESSMRNHPLTPMRHSDLKYLMERQSHYLCHLLSPDDLEKGCFEEKHYYLIPDYYEEKHGKIIAEMFGKQPFLSGGAGLLRMLAQTWERDATDVARLTAVSEYPVILAGSCSEATRNQIQYYEAMGEASYCIHPLEYAEGIQTIGQIKAFLDENKNRPVLVYTSASPDEVKKIKSEWKNEYPLLAQFNEGILSDVAELAFELGRKKFVVAGGETSGAVIQKLGFRSFYTGESIAPGVPIIYPIEAEGVAVILKSGNFGAEDFFGKTICTV